MILRWCECNRKHHDPTHTVSGFGDAIACSNCGAFIKCDFCKLEYRRIANFPISLMAIGDKFVCGEHAWAARARPADSENSN